MLLVQIKIFLIGQPPLFQTSFAKKCFVNRGDYLVKSCKCCNLASAACLDCSAKSLGGICLSTSPVNKNAEKMAYSIDNM